MTSANKHLQSAKTAWATAVVLQSFRPALDTHHTWNVRNPLLGFCEGLSVGDNILVWVSEEEKADNPDEEYGVAKIEQKAMNLEDSRKNDWIVFVRWYELSSTKKRRGNRFYKKGFVQWTPYGSIIRTLTQTVGLQWSGRYYQLSNDLNNHIEKFGDITHKKS